MVERRFGVGLLPMLLMTGCVEAVVPLQPVTVVATRTPGLAMVIVRPHYTRSSASDALDRSSEYVLLCDGRPADGMRCAIMPEVGADRRSRGIMPEQPAVAIDEGIATLSDATIRYSGEGTSSGTVLRDSSPAAAASAPSAAPPPPAAAPAPAAPTTAAPSAAAAPSATAAPPPTAPPRAPASQPWKVTP
jgi:hypothetical protein